MTWQVLIAHANGEEHLAERLAGPIIEAGYGVAHQGTVLVGESVIGEASKVLNAGGPVVLCGTIKALGTKWARRIVNAARHNSERTRVFCLQMEEEADVDSLAFDEAVACYWQDADKATQDLIAALNKHYPLSATATNVMLANNAEQRFRELALESCDIIDLANLPENDRHLAIRQLELRRLYVALRVRVEVAPGSEVEEAEFGSIERRRRVLRHRAFAWDEEDIGQEDGIDRVSIGERLGAARRLVVLGDPGAGKTTLIRWIATAYLLRLKQDPDWRDLPDVSTLPAEDWLPIIVRCRDLDQSCLSGSLDDVLGHTLRKAEISDDEALVLLTTLRKKLLSGQALLLLDGLDEIKDPAMRARFCRQLENVHVAYPQAPIIATSRIVGYREMGYRIGRGFEHLTVADLALEDKDDFARRWCAVTEPTERQEAAAAELIQDIHSTDRIERLTSNPMLLTTMALVKRKIGKLPSRRADLYWDALEVLLNWRREVDEPIDHREAVPQLQYAAYAMCDGGVQQLREDEVIALFDRMREEYPQIHPVRGHTSEDFLRLLERRTGILVQAGHVRHLGRPAPVFEFRHLTFQEYLAGLALVDGRFPGRDRSRSLAGNVAPLAARIREIEILPFEEAEAADTENWREALRLCVASCNDDDVDDVFRAILTPLQNEDRQITARPRAVLAALCLADEPNVSDEVAHAVLHSLIEQVETNDGTGYVDTGLDAAALELAVSQWGERLTFLLAEEFCRRDVADRGAAGGVCAMVSVPSTRQNEAEVRVWVEKASFQIASDNGATAVTSALSVMELAFQGRACLVPGLTQGLLSMLAENDHSAHAAAWALGWLNNEKMGTDAWQPTVEERDQIVSFVGNPYSDAEAARYLMWILARERDECAVDALVLRLKDGNVNVRETAVRTLGQIGSQRAVDALMPSLEDDEEDLRRYALGTLATTLEDEIDRILLSERLRDNGPYLDPQEEIDGERLQGAAEVLGLSTEETRYRYETLARKLALKLNF